MRDCEYFELLCSNSVDGTLTEEEQCALGEHLEKCPSCAALKRDLEQMQELFSADVEVPESLHEHIMERVEQEARLTVVQPERPVRRMPVFTMVAAAAVVVMVVLGGGVGRFFGTAGGDMGGNGAAASADAAADTMAGAGADDFTAEEQMKIAEQAQKDVEPAETDGEQAQQNVTQAPEPASDNSAPAAAGGGVGSPTAPVISQQTEGSQPEMQALAPEGRAVPASDESQQKPAVYNMESAPTLPQGVQGMRVASCYLASGSGELPGVEGTLLVSENGYSYFSVANNMTVIEKTLDSLEKAGYAVSAYDDVNLVTDSKAEVWLLITYQAS
ncbi:anti-sigma factor family protein [Agathobaculum sp.]|uniref:anti-sigma factor family protein n=1 Tax=Agathobaculum sp. TaxID=2048138 RepID=UPI002A80CECB|nr:zf-HC2 domain-containing protein [Agathobaculum sp.]MDY3618180.1 zf-HC2 domain-containing protein [Agathobaculum sp.]